MFLRFVAAIIIITTALGLMACGESNKSERVLLQPEKPSVAELHAYKAYHHTRYKVQTAEAAGGTNKLLNTRELPTEGTDPVVTPALDHLYSKAVIDLTGGPVHGRQVIFYGPPQFKKCVFTQSS